MVGGAAKLGHCRGFTSSTLSLCVYGYTGGATPSRFPKLSLNCTGEILTARLSHALANAVDVHVSELHVCEGVVFSARGAPRGRAGRAHTRGTRTWGSDTWTATALTNLWL